MKTIEDAIALAVEAHRGQTDKNGDPYIFHPLRVMLAVPNDEDVQKVAVLHDVIEDSDLTEEDLIRDGWSNAVVEGVGSCSRRDGETYDGLIIRCKRNPLGKVVKPYDIRDNLRPERLERLPAEDQARLTARYFRALEMLLP